MTTNTDTHGSAVDLRTGFRGQRGNTWANDSYEGAVPLSAAREVLDWEPVIGEVQVNVIDETGVSSQVDASRKAIVHPRDGHIISIVGSGYKPHPYGETLIDITRAIVDDTELQIASVGTLGLGARGFISFELPDTVQAAEGVEIRPFLNAASSLDGSLATQWFRACLVPICANMLAASIRTGVDFFKVRHTANSGVQLAAAREALNIVYQMTDEYLAEIEQLTSTVVADGEFAEFMARYNPIPEQPGRAQTMALEKRGILNQLWTSDERVAPWQGSAYGVLAMTNTYENNYARVRSDRLERNQAKLIDGTFEKSDRRTLKLLADVR